MLKSYFKTAVRFLLKNKTFSLLNITGLAAGTLCCLYIVLYVSDQYSYDKHFSDAKDIYRVTFLGKTPGNNPAKVGTCSPAIAPAMKKDFGEVEQFTRIVRTSEFGVRQHLLQYKDRSFYETDAAYADSTFFDMFTYHFLGGKASTALIQPYTVVLLEPVAVKLFGGEDPVGKVITIDNAYGKHDFTVTAVVDESLGKSHLHANLFMAMNSGGMGEYTAQDQSWAGDNFTFSYVRLNPRANPAALEKKLPAFLDKYGAQQLKAFGMEKTLHLQPVTAIHTTSGYNHDEHSVSSSFLYLLLLIGALIQLIACINFMNLCTAQASKRAKEIGVRKVIGAGRKDLVRQFLSESLLMSSLSVGVALPLLALALPFLNGITQTDIGLSFLSDHRLWLVLAGLMLLTGLIAGSYPAFYLSGFRTLNVIKGNLTSVVSAAGIRRSLVVFQFVLSIVLITGIIVIYSQLNYMKNKDLGFDKNQKLIFSFYTGDIQDRVPAFINDLRQMAEVKVVSRANNFLGQSVPNDWIYSRIAGDPAAGKDAKMMFTDEFFVRANGIRLISGRDFRDADSGKVLINETFAQKLGLNAETAPGSRLYPKTAPGEPVTWVEVAGVMKDFNFSSLHDEVNSFMLMYEDQKVKAGQIEGKSNVIVSTSSRDYSILLKKLQTIWRSNFPTLPFEYTFQDEVVQRQYQTEITLSRIINSFTIIAILISCLGLFGLAAFSAGQRNKEIGIRKVLGASVGSIVRLLSKDFLRLVAIAFVIAAPLAWWAMDRWLQGFAYRIGVSWWMLAIAGALAIFIAMFTISFQAIGAAMANPVKSLKSE
ncbi:MAG TPA: ABC transporter permease [Puia sp.]|nr:ABC transporter permease [Puia sp.]